MFFLFLCPKFTLLNPIEHPIKNKNIYRTMDRYKRIRCINDWKNKRDHKGIILTFFFVFFFWFLWSFAIMRWYSESRTGPSSR